jgi:protein-S-isoprenylcysteine O-methyltransferase Ste14
MSAVLSFVALLLALGVVLAAPILFAAWRRSAVKGVARQARLGHIVLGLLLIVGPGGCSIFFTGTNVMEARRPGHDFDLTLPWVVVLSGFPLAIFGAWLLRRAFPR